MYFWLVLFAAYKDDTSKYFLLDDEKFDDWNECEPPEGYGMFEIIWHGEIEQIITENV